MSRSNVFIHIPPTPITDLLLSPIQTKIYARDNSQVPVVHLQELAGIIPFPVSEQIIDREKQNPSMQATPGIVVLPIEGGGRGPVINYGEVISTGLLLELLTGVLGEAQLSAALQTRLDNITAVLAASADAGRKTQGGYATHNETIVLGGSWLVRPPKIELAYAQGALCKTIKKTVNGIVRVIVPNQEIVYGHSGLVNGNQFTVKAAILVYDPKMLVPVSWQSETIVAQPTGVSIASPVVNTTKACMGLEVRGAMTLESTAVPGVSGTIYAQINVDGYWATIAEFSHRFDANDNGVPVTREFSAITAYDQNPHVYKFRAYIVEEASDDVSSELTGSISISTVAESGSGEVLSNDLQIKWSAKE